MSEADNNKVVTPAKGDDAHSDYKDQSKINRQSSDQEQAPGHNSTNQAHHSSTAVKPKNNRNKTNVSERSGNSASKSALRGSRKSLASDANRSITLSHPEESLLNNKRTFNVLQNDKTLLSNRIVMLRKEEERLMKKIKGTRDKAEKIMEIKHRNEQKFQHKIEQEELEKLRIEQEREKLKEERERRQREFELQKQLILDDKRHIYHDYRKQKAFAVKHKSKVRMNAIKHNRIKREMVREEEKRIQDKLRKREEEKRKRNQLHYSMRVEDQKSQINKIDTEISAMEREEKEILERLKNSQKLEQDAYRSLENAIKTSVDSTEWRKQMIGKKPRLPIAKYPKGSKPRSNNSSVYEKSVK